MYICRYIHVHVYMYTVSFMIHMYHEWEHVHVHALLWINRIFHSVWLLPWWRGVTGRSLAGFWRHIQSDIENCDIENCEGWLSPSGHSSGGRALTAKVRSPRFNPGWLPVFHSSLKTFPGLSSCTYTHTYSPKTLWSLNIDSGVWIEADALSDDLCGMICTVQ